MNRHKKDQSPHRLHYQTSAVDAQGAPDDNVPEVAIVGRSNAGKSTLINGIAGARIATTSSTPGKTRMLNFFLSKHYRLVDMPGYGFSKRSGDEQSSWATLIEPYLGFRNNLVGLLIVMDIRRPWTQDEEDLLYWLAPRQLPAAIVATKSDKLNKTEIIEHVERLKKDSGIGDVLVTSSIKKNGYEEVEQFVFQSWIKAAEA